MFMITACLFHPSSRPLLAGLFALVLLLPWAPAYGDVDFATWFFDQMPIGPISPASDFIYGPADSSSPSGGNLASGHHASAATNWTFSFPFSGFTSDHWHNAGAVGATDYWQFEVGTVNFQDLHVRFDTFGSATGPAIFQFRYSTTGAAGTFTDFGSPYTVTTSITTHFLDLSSIAALNNNASAVFRLVDVSPPRGGAIDDGDGTDDGTDRVDNFAVSGLRIVPVREPATFWAGALGVVLLVSHQRRRLVRLLSNARCSDRERAPNFSRRREASSRARWLHR